MKADHFCEETLRKGSELTNFFAMFGWKNRWTKSWTHRIFALNIAKEILECLLGMHILPSVGKIEINIRSITFRFE